MANTSYSACSGSREGNIVRTPFNREDGTTVLTIERDIRIVDDATFVKITAAIIRALEGTWPE